MRFLFKLFSILSIYEESTAGGLLIDMALYILRTRSQTEKHLKM